MNFHNLISIFVFLKYVFLFLKKGSASTPAKRWFERRRRPSCIHSFEIPIVRNSFFRRKERGFDALELLFGRSILTDINIIFKKCIFITWFQFFCSKNMFFYSWRKEARAHQPGDGLRDAAGLLAFIVLKYQFFEILISEGRNVVLTLLNCFLAGAFLLCSSFF